MTFTFYCVSGPEVQVLDYQTQQLKLLPLIAAAYALNMAGLVNLHQYIVVQNEIELGNFDHMQEVLEGY